MKKTKIFITSILSATLLTACNTPDNSVDQNTATQNTTIENNIDQQNSGSSQQNSPSNSSSNDGNTANPNKTLSYTIGQQTFEKQYELVHSKQQDFSIQLTDQFYLMEEEPGMDAVVYKENEAIMMRVEVLSHNDWTYENAVENSKSFLTASSKDNSYLPFKLPANIDTESFTLFDSYIVENESDKIILLLFQVDDRIIRLTIFDDYITNVSEAFLIQGITIQ